MSPSHTMSAHWGKQIYTSWRQSRQGGSNAATGPSSSSPSSAQPPSPLPSPSGSGYFGEKRSMDSDRSTGGAPVVPRQPSGGWFGRRSS
ncbi:hypothetical protein RB595_002270 [Gaeumannomyces hyphopodioides]